MQTFDWNNYKDKIFNKYDDIEVLILNEKNRMITKDYIKKTLNKYGIIHNINNIQLFEIAMTHEGYVKRDFTELKYFKNIFKGLNIIGNEEIKPINNKNEVIGLKKISYELLEFFGDAILRMILTDYLVCRFSRIEDDETNEIGCGKLSSLRSQIENNSSFSEFCKLIGLNKYILLNRAFEMNNVRDKDINLQCDVFEAFIASLYFDILNINYFDIAKTKGLIKIERGEAFQKCYDFIINLIEDENYGLDICALIEIDTNYKTRLNLYYKNQKWNNPIYPLLETKNVNNKKLYKVGVYDNEKNIIACSENYSKQEAEKKCAQLALLHFGALNEYDEYDNNL